MGYSMGLLQVALGAGVALGPLIGGSIADIYDYNYTFYVTSALLFSAGLMVWLGVDEYFEPNQKLSDSWGSFVLEWRQILSAPGIVTTYSMRFITQLGRMMIVPIAPLFIQTLLVNSTRLNTFTGLVVGAASASATISAVYLGRVGDRIGQRRILITCTLAAGILYLPQSLVTAGWQLLILQASVGIALGGIIPAISALLAHYTRSGEEGAVYGLDNSINAGSRALAPLLGAAIGYLIGLRATFAVTAIFFLFASMLASWSLPKIETSMPDSYANAEK
jgi:DHA1 family multidrug resistance protein-like MFS transporter